MVEIFRISEENAGYLYGPCGPDSGEYLLEKSFLVNQVLKDKLMKGLAGFVAMEDKKVIGRVEIQPLELSSSPLKGGNHYHLPCIWVLPEYQMKGIGKALLQEAIKASQDRAGIITFTMQEINWMPEEFFLHNGFEKSGINYEPFSVLIKKNYDYEMPEVVRPYFEHKKNPSSVVIEIVSDSACPYFRVWQNSLKRIAEEYGDLVEVIEINPLNREEVLKYGSGNVFVDGTEPFLGPADPEEIRRVIEEGLKKKGKL